jgi:Domain of unknown function (DUF4190)
VRGAARMTYDPYGPQSPPPPSPIPPLIPAPQRGYPYGPLTPTVNGLAVASLVLGIFWLFWLGSFLALIFGYVALSQVNARNGAQTGRGLAITGVVLGWIGVGTLAFAIVIGVSVSHRSSGRLANVVSATPTTGVATLSRNTAHPPQRDVDLSACDLSSDVLGVQREATAHLIVTNHSSRQSTYIITVTFQDKTGVQIASGSAFVQNVDPGQTAKYDAHGYLTEPAPASLRCSVKDVERFAS